MPGQSSARRYAQAIFDLAVAAGRVDEWRREIGRACEIASDERLARAIDNPAVPFQYRRDAIAELLGDRVVPQVRNLALLLAQRGRFSLMARVSDQYDDLVRQWRGIRGVTVVTPTPLDRAELAELQRRIERYSGAKVEVNTAVDPSLVGGLRVRIGDLEIDDSVHGRLQRLRERLVQGTS
jgi:F-type H+-transporting ATPase subunit delta